MDMENLKQKDRPDLDEYGVLGLFGEINSSSAETLCRRILQINVEDRLERMQLLICSCGGDCYSGFMILDIMKWSRIPIATVGVGWLASMGLMIFMAGEKGHRILTPSTSLLSHRYNSAHAGSHSQIIAHRKQEDIIHERIVDHYLACTALKTKEEVEQTLLRDVDTWFKPQEALTFGMADMIDELDAPEGAKVMRAV